MLHWRRRRLSDAPVHHSDLYDGELVALARWVSIDQVWYGHSITYLHLVHLLLAWSSILRIAYRGISDPNDVIDQLTGLTMGDIQTA